MHVNAHRRSLLITPMQFCLLVFWGGGGGGKRKWEGNQVSTEIPSATTTSYSYRHQPPLTLCGCLYLSIMQISVSRDRASSLGVGDSACQSPSACYNDWSKWPIPLGLSARYLYMYVHHNSRKIRHVLKNKRRRMSHTLARANSRYSLSDSGNGWAGS